MKTRDVLTKLLRTCCKMSTSYFVETVLITLKPESMFVHINEPFLLERQFEKVYTVDYKGNYSIYYYKQGIYLKYLCDHYYAVYNDEMRLLGTIKNFYPVQILLVSKNYPLHMN